MSTSAGLASEALSSMQRPSAKSRAWRRFTRGWMPVAGTVWLLLIAVIAVIGPWIAPHSYSEAILEHANEGPSWQFPFGTDELGHDMFSIVLYSIRYSFVIAIGATLISFTLGMVIGITAGMAGGWVDQVLMRLTDFMFAFPSFYFSLIILVDIGRGLFAILIAIGVAQWAGFARLVRGLVLSIRDSDMVESGVAIGASPWYVATRYVFPNVINSVIVYVAFMFANMLVQDAMLSLLGMGLQPPKISFGTLMMLGITDMLGFPWRFAFPTGVFVLTLLAAMFVGDGLQEALNPKGSV